MAYDEDLADRIRELIQDVDGVVSGPMEMRGRAMDGWLRVEDSGITTDDQLRRWVEVGVARARALPAK